MPKLSVTIATARAMTAMIPGLKGLPSLRGANTGVASEGVEVEAGLGVLVVLGSSMPVLAGLAVVVAMIVAGPG